MGEAKGRHEGIELRVEVIHGTKGLQEMSQRQNDSFLSWARDVAVLTAFLNCLQLISLIVSFLTPLGVSVTVDLGQERVPNLHLG